MSFIIKLLLENEYTGLYLKVWLNKALSTAILCPKLTWYLFLIPIFFIYLVYPVIMPGLFKNYSKLFPKPVTFFGFYFFWTPEIHNVIWSEFHYYVKIFLSWDRKEWDTFHNLQLLWNMSLIIQSLHKVINLLKGRNSFYSFTLHLAGNGSIASF